MFSIIDRKPTFPHEQALTLVAKKETLGRSAKGKEKKEKTKDKREKKKESIDLLTCGYFDIISRDAEMERPFLFRGQGF